MSEPVSDLRIIKKYPNRRLYDTTISSYITLEDVRRLVRAHTAFCVKDAKTNEDLTRNILLQIIIEQEEGGQPIFTTEVLQQVIRFYGDALQGMIASYLDRSLSVFVEQQNAMREQLQNVVAGEPLSFIRELTEQNISVWQEMQESFLRAAVLRRRRGAKKEKENEGAVGRRAPPR